MKQEELLLEKEEVLEIEEEEKISLSEPAKSKENQGSISSKSEKTSFLKRIKLSRKKKSTDKPKSTRMKIKIAKQDSVGSLRIKTSPNKRAAIPDFPTEPAQSILSVPSESDLSRAHSYHSYDDIETLGLCRYSRDPSEEGSRTSSPPPRPTSPPSRATSPGKIEFFVL